MPPILCVVALFLFPGFVVKADPLSGDMVDDFLKELDDIGEVVNGNRIANRTTAVEMFQAAAASDKSAVEFYLKCVKMLRFDSRDAKFSEYRDWREKNEDRLKNDSYILALRLQLQYLVLTLRVAEGTFQNNQQNFDRQIPFRIAEKTDFSFEAKSSSGDNELSIFIETVLMKPET